MVLRRARRPAGRAGHTGGIAAAPLERGDRAGHLCYRADGRVGGARRLAPLPRCLSRHRAFDDAMPPVPGGMPPPPPPVTSPPPSGDFHRRRYHAVGASAFSLGRPRAGSSTPLAAGCRPARALPGPPDQRDVRMGIRPRHRRIHPHLRLRDRRAAGPPGAPDLRARVSSRRSGVRNSRAGAWRSRAEFCPSSPCSSPSDSSPTRFPCSLRITTGP